MSHVSPFIFFKMAFLSLKRHPVRSGLALLGIVIGIAALITTMGIGEGANQKIQEQILAMGENHISINSGNIFTYSKAQQTRQKEKPLTFEDYLAIRSHFSTTILAGTPTVSDRLTVKAQGVELVTKVEGYNEEIFKLETRHMKKGRAFSEYHSTKGLRVVVLGNAIAKTLFKHTDPIGKVLTIKNIPFTVIGVLEESKPSLNTFQTPDLDVIVPFSTLWKKIIPADSNRIDDIILKPMDKDKSIQLIASLRRLLRFRHQIVDQQPDDFTIWDMQAILKASNKSSEVLNNFLLIAAGTSLLVGGIGIMNIMLVSMVERKKEIGLKLAIGATSSHIMIQFLLESVMLCLIGGLLGILTGIVTTLAIGHFAQFPWYLDSTPMLVAFTTTLVIGLFFGFYPAYKASKLNPIEALNAI